MFQNQISHWVQFRNVLSPITSKNSYYADERKIMSSSLDNLEQGKDKKEKTKP